MTIASCFACGEFKVGAFTPCPACGNAPATLEQETQSLALTDHYLAPEELEHVQSPLLMRRPLR